VTGLTPTESELDACAGRMLQSILRRTHLSSAADLAGIAADEARAIGVERLVVHVIDYEQKWLIPVPAGEAAAREPLSVNGTVAGRAFATSELIEIDPGGGAGRRLWVPLLDGTERTGVMEVAFAGEGPLTRALVATCERLGHLVAVLVVAKSAYSDFFELLRRNRRMTTASELLWELVPPLVLAGDGFVLSGLLEPCYDAGGDAFDYALNENILHFGIFDGMGHGLAAAGVTAFALSVYRHSRRQGQGPAAAYAAIDAALAEQYPTSVRFATALIAELDVPSGRLRWVSAGHPPPLLLRSGRVNKALDVAPGPPLGLRLAEAPPVEAEESLEPGDMVLLYTDGLTEARRPDGELFTVERLAEFIERQAASGHAAPEMLRRLREAIIERGEGSLRDDASAVLLEWRRGSERTLVPDTV
jgi:serine/threonine protein phosphatase PrpC